MSESRLNIKFNTGNLDTVINIQSPTNTFSSTTGEQLTTYSTLKTVFGCIENMAGEEMQSDNVQIGTDIYKVTIRYSSVSLLYRLNFDSQYYNIKRIEQIGRKRFTVLYCELIKTMS